MLEKVKFISQREAEKMPGWDSAAMISITQPHGVQANLMAGWYAIHRVTFHDVDPVNKPVNPKKIRFSITAQQAFEIVRFVNEISPVVKTLIVHCGGGISRSAAISKWMPCTMGFLLIMSTIAITSLFLINLLSQQINSEVNWSDCLFGF